MPYTHAPCRRHYPTINAPPPLLPMRTTGSNMAGTKDVVHTLSTPAPRSRRKSIVDATDNDGLHANFIRHKLTATKADVVKTKDARYPSPTLPPPSRHSRVFGAVANDGRWQRANNAKNESMLATRPRLLRRHPGTNASLSPLPTTATKPNLVKRKMLATHSRRRRRDPSTNLSLSPLPMTATKPILTPDERCSLPAPDFSAAIPTKDAPYPCSTSPPRSRH
ncbi:hypothetical protein C8R45DRAFT_1102353 [Mycena sanguinolenta]|nr:hypothetical protein C8R45DRAFT_1102353 [Mycena sanguinolenta]